jgi:hypothetical protein
MSTAAIPASTSEFPTVRNKNVAVAQNLEVEATLLTPNLGLLK